jgi:hypothetical protein
MEWKQFFRSSYWQKSIAIKILMGVVALQISLSFLGLGFGLYPLLKEQFPDKDPLNMVNNLVFFWLLIDLLYRFFLQKLPVMSVKPLLVLPVKRRKIVNYVLGKSVFSFFNFLPLFVIIPFGIILISKGYNIPETITWMLLMYIFTLSINFINFIIESMSAGAELSFLPIILLITGLFALDHFNIIPVSSLLSGAINSITSNPILILIPLTILFLLIYSNYNILKQKLYVDASLKNKAKIVSSTDMSWTGRFGDMAPFLKLDMRMIWRNKRSRSTLYMVLIGLLYGLFFYPNPHYQNMVHMFIFVGIFVTGIFMINFGQFIPAWDSAYYKLLMSQNIKYKEYLDSKFLLMTLSSVLLFILSIPYVYFGWKILLIHFAAMVYNVGVNSHVLLYGGSFNRKRIELSQRAAFNYQGTGAVQWIIGLPLLAFPVLFFYLPYKFFGFEAGFATLIIMGGIGIVFHQKIMKWITGKYLASKYEMISAFGQNN